MAVVVAHQEIEQDPGHEGTQVHGRLGAVGTDHFRTRCDAGAALLLVLLLRNCAGQLAQVILDKAAERAIRARYSIEPAHDAGLRVPLVEHCGGWQAAFRGGEHDDGFVGGRMPNLGQALDVGLEDMG